MTDEQARALAEGIERLSYALQILAVRASYSIGGSTANEIREIGGAVNRSICDAFPELREDSETAGGKS